MKRSLVVLACALVLFVSPALYACEKCLTSGYDSVGNPITTAKCEAGHAEGFASCVPSSSSTCTTGTDSVCKGKAKGTPWVNHGFVPPSEEPADCATDLSGGCSGPRTQMESFLG